MFMAEVGFLSHDAASGSDQSAELMLREHDEGLWIRNVAMLLSVRSARERV